MDLSGLGLPTLQGTGTSAIAGGQLAENFDTFLTLLTSQLKNQDPLEPMKSEQFTQQLVQFSQVEQQISTNDMLESLISLSLAAQHGALVDFIGKTVEGPGDRARLQDGSASWTFDLEKEPEEVSVLITNSSGLPVFATTTVGHEGTNEFLWDGRDNSGNTLPDDTYRISISATDSSGTAITSTVRTVGVVDGIEVVNGVAQLTVNGTVVPLNEVTSVSATPAAASE